MADFETALNLTLYNEGGYSNHPNDTGGATMWGITENEARNYGYVGKMVDMPLMTAKLIYKTNYWNTIQGDKIENQVIANVIFDTGVNMHWITAVKMAQRVLNVSFGYTLKVDGLLGEMTLSALNSLGGEDLTMFMADYTARRINRYRIISVKRPENYVFVNGWYNRALRYIKNL